MRRAISVILSLLLLVSVTPVALATGDGDAMDWAALKEALKAGGEITLPNDVAAPDGAGALSVPKASTVTLDQKAEFTVSLGGEVDRGVMFLLNSEPKYTAPFPAQYGDWITVLFYPEDQMISAMTYTYTENGKTVTNTISFYENGDHVEGRFRMPNGNVTVAGR